MSMKKDAVINDMFNLRHPWTLGLVSYNKHLSEVYLLIDYDSDVLSCPFCGKRSSVMSKTPVIWQFLDCFHYKSFVTTYLPLIDCCCDPSTLKDVVLLNLILNQLKNTEVLSSLNSLNLTR